MAELKAAGHDVVCLHRDERTGYKAGALAEGLGLPRANTWRYSTPISCPQADFSRTRFIILPMKAWGWCRPRWEHLNRDYSLLTQVQAIFLDGHFMMEHGARSRSGLFFNFNGTAGIWRRACIDDAGGWENDTLTEDLDLSYRAQLPAGAFCFWTTWQRPRNCRWR